MRHEVTKRRRPLPSITLAALLTACGGVGYSAEPSGSSFIESLAPVSIASAVVEEGDSATRDLLSTVSLDTPANGYVNINYARSNGTAKGADNDYVPASGLLTIEPRFTSSDKGKSAHVQCTKHRGVFGMRHEVMKRRRALPSIALSAMLTACGGGGSSTEPSGSSFIESLPQVSIANAVIDEGNSGTRDLLFTVSLDKPANGYVNISYATSDGTAKSADNDYLPATGLLTIEPGFTSTLLAISILGDTIPEGDETVIVTISNPTPNVTVGRSVSTGSILNDEQPSGDQSTLPDLPRGVISTGGKRMPINQEIIDNPNISGFMVLDAWNMVEPLEGVFDWTHIDSEVARAKAAGKAVRLSIHTGGDSVPAWLFQNYPEVKKVIAYDKFTGDIKWLPAYWDAVFIDVKRRFYEALGNRYKDEPTVFAISAAMVDPNTGDWSFRADTDEQIQSYMDAGFSEEVFIDAYKAILDNGMAAFRNKYVITAVGPVPSGLVSDGYYGLHQVLDYAFAAYGSRLIIAKGSLNAGTPFSADLPANHHWTTMLRYAPNAIGQFVHSVTGDAEYQMNRGTPYGEDEMENIFWTAVLIGKSYNLRWIEPWGNDLVNPVLQDEVDAAAELLSSD